MKIKTIFIGLISLIIPGLGHIILGKNTKGAFILIAFIIVGNLNVLWLSMHAVAMSIKPYTFFGHYFPRILHDIFAFYGIIFLLWQTIDAIIISLKKYDIK